MSIKEVTVTIYVCSICKKDQDHDAEVTPIDLTYPGAALRLDVCPNCWNTNKALATLLSLAENNASNGTGRVNGRSADRAKSPKASTRPAKRKTTRATSATVKLQSCPEPGCDYGPKRANVIGVHRAKTHGYVSPRLNKKPAATTA